uniref:Putative ecdysteroid kinase n=1 Tax=Lutzomyia longipalpis TaxID=7200 RepID=A0A1B0C984_LUTLO
MDADFFQDILSKIFKEERNIQAKEIVVSVPKGNSSTDDVFRSKIIYTSDRKCDKSISIIIKKLSSDKEDPMKNSLVMRHSKSMSVEVDMHVNILPVMHRLLEVSGIKSKFGPQLYANISGPCDVLILEDLHEEYEIISERFDIDNMETVLTQLAQFHAASYYMAAEDFTKEALKWPEFKDFHAQIQGLEEKFIDARNYLYRFDTDYNVLNHGDFHMRNILFKIADNSIQHVIMHDFQTNVWCSPALDLIYTFYLIADSQTLHDCRSQMLSSYHRTFVSTLKSMGFMGQAPTLLDLNVELLRNGFIEIFVSIVFLPYQFVQFASKQLQARIAKESSANARSLLYTIPEYQKAMKKLFETFLYKGFFDI